MAREPNEIEAWKLMMDSMIKFISASTKLINTINNKSEGIVGGDVAKALMCELECIMCPTRTGECDICAVAQGTKASAAPPEEPAPVEPASDEPASDEPASDEPASVEPASDEPPPPAEEAPADEPPTAAPPAADKDLCVCENIRKIKDVARVAGVNVDDFQGGKHKDCGCGGIYSKLKGQVDSQMQAQPGAELETQQGVQPGAQHWAQPGAQKCTQPCAQPVAQPVAQPHAMRPGGCACKNKAGPSSEDSQLCACSPGSKEQENIAIELAQKINKAQQEIQALQAEMFRLTSLHTKKQSQSAALYNVIMKDQPILANAPVDDGTSPNANTQQLKEDTMTDYRMSSATRQEYRTLTQAVNTSSSFVTRDQLDRTCSSSGSSDYPCTCFLCTCSVLDISVQRESIVCRGNSTVVHTSNTDVPVVATEEARKVNLVSDDGTCGATEIVNSQTISSKVPTEIDEVVETRVEQEVTILSDEDPFDHNSALNDAIQEAIGMDPNMVVEKIEI